MVLENSNRSRKGRCRIRCRCFAVDFVILCTRLSMSVKDVLSLFGEGHLLEELTFIFKTLFPSFPFFLNNLILNFMLEQKVP